MLIVFSLNLKSVEVSFELINFVKEMSDRLVEIDRKDWSSLKQLYTPDGDKSYTAYITIDSYIRCIEQNPNDEYIKLYCLNGDFSDGTFAVTVSKPNEIYSSLSLEYPLGPLFCIC